ncbi:uncharacterized protein ATNIH1004_000146 [Aspergillus tanneri]|uniref:Uncharacterized protein n=1 Tax=Aspergillus tanneri TaxID=1220188 RepID=A0A5M9MVZ6_9EURO|nr:uncharacterized protein ATNIH1004_000146 [Aspergillus tanneri]KAA8651265.1 hypothetical protein ATNIH1004_000146 [Aspergillus tanneri]
MRAKVPIAVLQAAAIQAILAAPPYGADSISSTRGDIRSARSSVSVWDHGAGDKRRTHLLGRAYGDDTLYVDEPGLAPTYEGDDGIVPVNPSYKDTSAGDPITVPSGTGDTGAGSQPAAQNEGQSQSPPNGGRGSSGLGTLADIGSGLLGASGGLFGGLAAGKGVADGILGGGGSAASGILGGGGSAAPEGSLGTNGGTGALENAGTIGTAATDGTAGAASTGNSPTFEGDVSNPPPAQKPAEIYIDENGNEGPVPWTSEENTFSLDVQDEGEGALSESGRPGPYRGSGGPSQAGKSQSKGIDFNNFRESVESEAKGYLKTPNSKHVKAFDGGRSPAEKQLFKGLKDNYSNLKEVKATSSQENNWASRDRGRYRYISGTDKSGKEVLIGIAEHGPNSNSFVNFKHFQNPKSV